MADKQIRIPEKEWSSEDEKKLAIICAYDDQRSQGEEVAHLIRKRFEEITAEPINKEN